MQYFQQEQSPSKPKMQKRTQAGVSLVEILLVLVGIGFIVIIISNLPNALGLVTKSRYDSVAREIAVKQIEDKRSVSYLNLVNGTQPIVDSRLSILPSGTGTLIIADCDPILICTNSEAVKHIKVTISWKHNGKDQNLKLETFIGEGGLK